MFESLFPELWDIYPEVELLGQLENVSSSREKRVTNLGVAHPCLSAEETGGLVVQAGAGHLFLVGAELLPRPASVQGL